jgi:hypothetical protein
MSSSEVPNAPRRVPGRDAHFVYEEGPSPPMHHPQADPRHGRAIAEIPGDADYREPILCTALDALRPANDG